MSKRMKISKGGQISIPAEIRRRWNTTSVVLTDDGERIVIEPARGDAIDRAAGALRRYFEGVDLAELRRASREGEREVEERKLGG